MYLALTRSHAGSIFPDGDALAQNREGCDLLAAAAEACSPSGGCSAPRMHLWACTFCLFFWDKMGLVVLLMGSGDKEGLASLWQ